MYISFLDWRGCLALNTVNVVAVTTILVLYVGVIGHHVPRQSCLMLPRRTITARLRAKRVWGGLDPQAGGLGGLQRAQGSREVWRAAGRRPPGPCVYVCGRMCVC